MIIARSPLRISLGGGGTDLSSYYRNYEGFVIAAAIDKYVYVTINRPFLEGIYLKYSKIENTKKISSIKHKIIREVLSLENLKTPQIEITTLADIPAGTGLGSSGSFTLALLKALYAYRKKKIHQEELAELACDIEINRLKLPTGKQDQYISAIGGLTSFTFHKNNKITTTSLNVSVKTLFQLEDNLLLFFTGYTRTAASILKDQKIRSEKKDVNMIKNLHYVKELGYESKVALENGNLELFGELMHKHWENKKKRSEGMSNSKIDYLYQLAIKNGAIGGKLVGAGGGGFLMFMAKDRIKLKETMQGAGLEEVRFKFDFEGTKIIHS
jgi:D-glycero-alpha-D-manno-heptose-7-phosphate kinase